MKPRDSIASTPSQLETRAVLGELLDDGLERRRIREHRRDVLEHDAGLREVRHVDDQRLDLERAHCWMRKLLGQNAGVA